MTWYERWVPRAVAALGFAAYALLAPAGPAWLDASEIGAAQFQLGSPHPTGFPIDLVLAKAVSLLPVGEIAFRMHLASAAAAALAMLWVARLVIGVRPDAAGVIGGAVGALVMGLSLTFARHATVTEVYAPTAAFIAGALLLYDRVARGGDARVGLLLALVTGLGIGAHSSFRLLLLGPLLFLLVIRLRRGARWPLAAPVVALTAAAAIHAMLPVRSATGRTAPVDWGSPRDLGGLVGHTSARDIREGFADEMLAGDPLVVGEHLRRVTTQASDDLGVLALIAALGGVVWLSRERRARWLLLALGCLALGDVAYAVWVNPMGIPDGQNGVPLSLAIGSLAGVGVAWLGRFAGRAGVWAAVAAGAMTLVAPALASWPELEAARGGEAARRLSEAALAAARPGGTVLTQSDSLSAGVLWLGVVEGDRPDVERVVRQRVGAERVKQAVERGGAVWEIGDDRVPEGWRLRIVGTVGMVEPELKEPELKEPDDEQATGDRRQATGDRRRDDLARGVAAWREVLGAPGGRGEVGRRMVANGLTNLGRVAYERGDVGRALALFDAALEVRADHVVALVNRGVVLAARGEIAEAARVTEQALAIEPNRVRALVNAARYRLAAGDIGAARRHAARAVRLAPDRADVREVARAVEDVLRRR